MNKQDKKDIINMFDLVTGKDDCMAIHEVRGVVFTAQRVTSKVDPLKYSSHQSLSDLTCNYDQLKRALGYVLHVDITPDEFKAVKQLVNNNENI